MTVRWPALVLLVALAVGAVVVGRDAPDPTPASAVDPATLLPVGAPDDALDSTWFCAGQTAREGSAADGTVIVANVGDDAARGRIDVVSDEGETASETLEVEAHTTTRIAVSDLLEADWASAMVTFDRGAVAVEHEVVGPQGRDTAPCHSRTDDRWYLPAGSTTRDSRYYLAVYNPSSIPATVDMEFATDEGARRPGDLQGIPVAPGSMVAVNVASAVTVRDLIAATVTARRGRVVVDRIQTWDGRGAATTQEEAETEAYRRLGLTLTPAVPAARGTWSFPAGVRGGDLHEILYVHNPGDSEVEVEVEVALDDPRRNGLLDPIPLTVARGEVATFDLDETPGIPDLVRHSVTVSAEDGRRIVAERTFVAVGETDYHGVATSTGSPVAADRWVFADGGRSTELDALRIALLNPGDDAVDVELVASGDGTPEPVAVDEPITIGPGERFEMAIDDLPDGRRTVTVSSSAPIVAERRILATSGAEEAGLGASTAIGIPFGRLIVLG